MGLRVDIERELARLDALSPSGFAIAFHVRFTTASYQLQSYPEDWLDVYSKEGLVMQDPIVGFGFEQTGWTRWSDLAQNDPGGVLDRARAFGLAYGVAIAVDDNDSRTVAGLARPDREFTDKEIEEVERIIRSLHDLTLDSGSMSEKARDELKRLSVRLTHHKPASK